MSCCMIFAWPPEVSVSTRPLAFVQKRRSTRIYNAVPLAVQGSDAFRAPYLEHVSTLTVNCHGCRYRSNYEVIQGDTVYLEIEKATEGGAAYSYQAEVKRVQRLVTMNSSFEVAVELEVPGNIWGIVSPPGDWFPIRLPKTIGREGTRQEPPLPTRIEQQANPILSNASTHLFHLQKEDPTATAPPSLGQPVADFDTQIQTIFSQLAAAAFTKDRDHLMGECRMQLQNEAMSMLQRVISNSREELMRPVFNELHTAYEAAARFTYEHWNKKIEQDTKNAAQLIVSQGVEVSRRVEGMMVTVMERLRQNMEASRTDATKRFLSRLWEQLEPLLHDAQASLGNLKASEDRMRDESREIRERFDDFLYQAAENSIGDVQQKTLGMLDQFDNDVTRRILECQEELHELSVKIIAETTVILNGLPQNCEGNVLTQLRLLISTAAAEVILDALGDETVQSSSELSNWTEGSNWSNLELAGGLVEQFRKKTVVQSGD